MNSSEYRRLRVREAYVRILGRAADTSSLTYWASKLAAGTRSSVSIVVASLRAAPTPGTTWKELKGYTASVHLMLSPVASQAHQRICRGQQRHFVLLELCPPGQVFGTIEGPLTAGLQEAHRRLGLQTRH